MRSKMGTTSGSLRLRTSGGTYMGRTWHLLPSLRIICASLFCTLFSSVAWPAHRSRWAVQEQLGDKCGWWVLWGPAGLEEVVGCCQWSFFLVGCRAVQWSVPLRPFYIRRGSVLLWTAACYDRG